jgi:diguanylate cyclase (GGDEF)-like protein
VRLVVAGIALSVVLLGAQSWLPERRLDLTQPGSVSHFFLTGTMTPPDSPPVHWVDADRHHWHCRYPQGTPSEGCGIVLVMTADDPARGMNLEQFDRLEVDMVYRGAAPFVRVALRNFDPRFSKVADGNSARMQSVNLRQRDVAHPVVLDLAELTVPEWWITQFNLPREYNRPSTENVTSLAVDIPGDVSGSEEDIELRHLVLKGPWIPRSTTYLGLLCGWLIAASLLVARHWRALGQVHNRQQREIDALTQRTSQLRIEQEGLRRMATIDEMTGVLNRRGLEQSLHDFEEAAKGMTLVLLDVDHFKRVNDRHGHDCGDEVLRRVAAVVAANLRASDVFGRWGGEEFLIACTGTRLRDAARLAEKLRERIENSQIGSSAGRIHVTASFGVALAPPGALASGALKRADQALYRAKDAGRNRVEIDKTLQSDAPSTV